jgi:hypothetical protein
MNLIMKWFSLFLLTFFFVLSAASQAVTNSNSNAAPQEVPAASSEKEISIEEEDVKNSEEIQIGSKKKSLVKSTQLEEDQTDLDEVQVVQDFNSKQEQFVSSKQAANYQRTQRTPSAEQQRTMNDAVHYFETHSPESFEYHYFKYLSGNNNITLRDHILKAESLRPENSDVHIQLVALYTIEKQEEHVSDYLVKLFKSGRLPESSTIYAEDVLLSCSQGAVLLSHAFEDTYSLWYQQHVKGIRPDVQIISIDLIQSHAYRDQLVADGFRIPTIEIIGVEFVEEFIQLNSDMYPSLSMTIPKEYFQKLMPNLFIQGLTFVFDQKGDVKINNADLWNNALKKHLISAAKDDKGKQLSANYLPVMLTVREYYQNEQNEEKIEELDIEIVKVVVQSKKQSVYSKLKE